MTLIEIRHAINSGHKVCWATSRYEVYINKAGELAERDIYNGTGSLIDDDSAKRCFIKSDGV